MSKKTVGAWESSTKGIGSKLLQKMGWMPGQGLGTLGTGRQDPVVALSQPKGVGLGFLDSEPVHEHESWSSKTKPARDEDQSPVKKPAEKKRKKNEQWRLGAKLHYRTAADIMRDEGVTVSGQGGETPVKVLDMRGQAVREHDSMEALLAAEVEPETSVMDLDPLSHLPELQFNIQQLASRSEEDLRRLTQSLRYEKEKLKSVQEQMDRMDTFIDQKMVHTQNLRLVLEAFDMALETMKQHQVQYRTEKDLDPIGARSALVEKSVSTIKELVIPIFDNGHTRQIVRAEFTVASVLQPVINELYHEWDPLVDPERGVAIFSLLKPYCSTRAKSNNNSSSYEALLWHVWLPKVRSSINNTWNAKMCDSAISFMEAWKTLLTPFVLDNVLKQLIFPKIEEEIDLWEPKRDKLPVHTWLFPWLPLLGDRLELLFVTIRHKLSRILKDCDVKDGSAFALFHPWKGVFDNQTIDQLVTTHVTPKLALLMTSLAITPAAQDLSPFRLFIQWYPMMRKKDFYRILRQEFFYKWLKVLYSWLSMPEKTPTVYAEIQQWYLDWKGEFPSDLASDKFIQSNFTLALNMMNQAVAETGIEHFLPDIERLKMSEPQLKPRVQQDSRVLDTNTQLVSFKETVEAFASRHNITFTPTTKVVVSSGAPIYKFGTTNIILKDAVIYAQLDGSQDFEPVSFEELLQKESN